MNRHVLLAVGVLATASCGKDETKFQNQPGLLDEHGNTRKPPPAPPVTRPAQPAPEPFADDYRPPPVAQAAPVVAEPIDAAVEDAPPRDLGAELSALLPRITSCVDLAQAAMQRDGRLVVTASAVVLGTGSISRATISAPGQPPGAIACLQQQILTLSLADGVPGAPLSVQGTTELTVKPVRMQAPDAAVASPIPTGPPIPVAPRGTDVAQPQADDMARPVNDGLAGPP